MTRPAAAALLALAVLLGACRGGGSDDLVLDGSPRYPDDEGLVTAISHEKVTLDGTRTYKVSPELESFNTFNLGVLPVLQTKDRYVQIGLDDETMTWLAAFGRVVSLPEKTVFYVGKYRSLDGDRVVFRDGTVLRLRRGLKVPAGAKPGLSLQATIDVGSHRVINLTLT